MNTGGSCKERCASGLWTTGLQRGLVACLMLGFAFLSIQYYRHEKAIRLLTAQLPGPEASQGFSFHPETEATGKVVLGGKYIPFSGTCIEGNEIDTDAIIRVSRYTLIAFLSPGCPPCQVDATRLAHAYSTLRQQGISMIGILTATHERARAFVDEHEISFPVIVDSDMRVAHELYETPGTPFYIVVDSLGVVRWVRFGRTVYEDRCEVADYLDHLLETADSAGVPRGSQ